MLIFALINRNDFAFKIDKKSLIRPKYFILGEGGVFVKVVFLFISNSNCLLMVYRKMIGLVLQGAF